jgi:hypothetical protein
VRAFGFEGVDECSHPRKARFEDFGFGARHLLSRIVAQIV